MVKSATLLRRFVATFAPVNGKPLSSWWRCTLCVCMLSSAGMVTDVAAQTDSVPSIEGRQIDEVTVVTRRSGTTKSRGLLNGTRITGEELIRAACCNLGESFTTNPSVDVSYSDAATGAKQIRLLGLSGSYVQMLAENIPDYRGTAAPYSLGYIAGPWMESIQVSKGSASVKNGYESMTGQINVEFRKPDTERELNFNVYGNIMSKLDVNADGNTSLNDRLSTNLLAHFENTFDEAIVDHDNNGDGFIDEPKVRQLNLRNAWVYRTTKYMLRAAVGALWEDREGGQDEHHGMTAGMQRYRIDMTTARYTASAKNAFFLNTEHNTSIALIVAATMHRLDAVYGLKSYGVNQKNAYASLIFETDITPKHNISAGISFNHDYYGQSLLLPAITDNEWTGAIANSAIGNEHESTPGAYAQYTYNLNDKLVVMAGLRADHSSRYGSFVTPRAHLKWAPNDVFALRLSAGKGYRTVHAWAENNNLLAGGRQVVADDLEQEEAWNYGISTTLYIPLCGKTLNINAEYYYTDFSHQVLIDYDSDPAYIFITNLRGKSYSHTWQVDASCPVGSGITLTAAYRRTNVKATYNGRLMEKPLTSKYKGLVTASYKTPLGLWQIDCTLQLNGGGRMPTPYTTADGSPSWSSRYHAYEQLSAQVTRWFRHFSVYIGGENLTNVKQKNPIINAADPYSTSFEPTLVYGPIQGAMAYAGVRIKL